LINLKLESMKVSIIIPLYNVENYVVESLKSAFAQTYSNIEYLLIDDCSTDHTMQMVEEYVSNHSRKEAVRIIHHNKNLGLSAARNTGVKHANGEFIFFMDSDDEISANCIEKHCEAITSKNADFTVANVLLEGAKSIHIKPIASDVVSEVLLVTYLKRKWSISAWNKLYRRDFLQRNNLSFREGLLHEDILWSYQLSCKAQRMALVEETTYIYKIHEGSITTNKNGSKKIESLLYILQFMDDDREHGIPDNFLCLYYHMFDFWRLNTAILLLDYNGSYEDAKSYYTQLSKLGHKSYNNIYSIILKLPFGVYKYSIGPLYKLYKRFR